MREELTRADLRFEPVPELEPTLPAVSPDEGIKLEGRDLVLEENVVETPKPPPPPPKKGVPTLKPLGRPAGGKAAAPEPPRVKPVVPKRPSAPTAKPAATRGGGGGSEGGRPGTRHAVARVPPRGREPE